MEFIDTFGFADCKLGTYSFKWILDWSFVFVGAIVNSFMDSLLLAFLNLIVLNLFLTFGLMEFKIYHLISDLEYLF